MMCRLLKSISGIGGVVNLQYLKLTECPELDTLPNFDKLASLKVFILRHGNKVQTVQGLQRCTSLEELEIQGTCWEVSSLESWEHVQRLRRVQLVAKKRSDVERCIQTIQKWPQEIIICTKAIAGAGSLLDSSAFPNLNVVHSFANKEIDFDLKFENRSSDGNGMMLCLVINCRSPSMRLGIVDKDDDPTVFSGQVEEGNWTLIGAFTQHSARLTAREFRIFHVLGAEKNEVEKGMIVRGEDENMVEGFRRSLALLAS